MRVSIRIKEFGVVQPFLFVCLAFRLRRNDQFAQSGHGNESRTINFEQVEVKGPAQNKKHYPRSNGDLVHVYPGGLKKRNSHRLLRRIGLRSLTLEILEQREAGGKTHG